MSNNDYMFPTSVKEVQALGWDYIDVIFFSGDAFVDHPSFGTAVIARWLQKWGYRVAVVPQPNWRDDLRDFRKLGTPRLYFALNSGAMDSMVNHYTASKRLRHDDAYTPDGKAGARPDYAVTVYTQILKKLFPELIIQSGCLRVGAWPRYVQVLNTGCSENVSNDIVDIHHNHNCCFLLPNRVNFVLIISQFS